MKTFNFLKEQMIQKISGQDKVTMKFPLVFSGCDRATKKKEQKTIQN